MNLEIDLAGILLTIEVVVAVRRDMLVFQITLPVGEGIGKATRRRNRETTANARRIQAKRPALESRGKEKWERALSVTYKFTLVVILGFPALDSSARELKESSPSTVFKLMMAILM